MEENVKPDIDAGRNVQREEPDAEQSPPQAPEIAIDDVSFSSQNPVV